MRSESEMNIIRMAREAGAGEPESLYGRTDYVVMTKHELERFAALVRAAERKPLTKEQLLYVYNKLPNWGMDMDSLPKSLEQFARAIEREHDIGGEE